MGWRSVFGESGGGARGGGLTRKKKSPQLTWLILSGCYRITDEGLR